MALFEQMGCSLEGESEHHQTYNNVYFKRFNELKDQEGESEGEDEDDDEEYQVKDGEDAN